MAGVWKDAVADLLVALFVGGLGALLICAPWRKLGRALKETWM